MRELIEADNITELQPADIFSFLIKQYRQYLIYIVFLSAVEMACRLVFSIMLQQLFLHVTQLKEGDSKTDAYLHAMFCAALWFTSQVHKHNAIY